MLIAENIDKPGVIGQLGTLLGVSKVNIATMQLGRKVTDQRAMMVLTVDSDISPDTLGFVGGVEGMIKANFVKL